MPVQAGRLTLFGVADLRGTAPSFDGGVALQDGIAAGLPISGGVDITLAGRTAHVREGVGELGSTYAAFSGRVDGIGDTGPTALAYDLWADVPIGDVASLQHTLRLPVKYLEGSFAAAVRVRGYGAQPNVSGEVTLPEGSYNGLAFRDGSAAVMLNPSTIVARNGALTVGSTRAAVSADVSVAHRAFAVDVRSADARLADFNDYFDEAETLDGRGAVAFSLANDGTVTRTSGRVDVAGFRYRRFSFGQTDATWSQRRGSVAAALNVRGTHGSLQRERDDGRRAGRSGRRGTARHVSRQCSRAARRPGHLAAAVRHHRAGDRRSQRDRFGCRSLAASHHRRRRVARQRLDRRLRGRPGTRARARRRLAHRASRTRCSIWASCASTSSGSTGFSTTEPVALAVHVQTPDIAKALMTLRPKGPHYDIGGALQADARVVGTIAKPRATLGFELTNGRYTSLAIPRVLGNVGYDGQTVSVYDAEATFAKGSVLVAGSLPFSLQPFGVNPTAPLSFTLALGGLDLGAVRAVRPRAANQARRNGSTGDWRSKGRRARRASPAPSRWPTAATCLRSTATPVTKANAQLTLLGNERRAPGAACERRRRNARRQRPARPAVPGRQVGGYSIAIDAHGARVDFPHSAAARSTARCS